MPAGIDPGEPSMRIIDGLPAFTITVVLAVTDGATGHRGAGVGVGGRAGRSLTELWNFAAVPASSPRRATPSPMAAKASAPTVTAGRTRWKEPTDDRVVVMETLSALATLVVGATGRAVPRTPSKIQERSNRERALGSCERRRHGRPAKHADITSAISSRQAHHRTGGLRLNRRCGPVSGSAKPVDGCRSRCLRCCHGTTHRGRDRRLPRPGRLARFWSEALDWVISRAEDPEWVVEPPEGSRDDCVVADLLFIEVPELKKSKNRLHLDLRPEDQAAEITRLEGLGATRVDVGQGDGRAWVVMADPEGNEFCVQAPHRPEVRAEWQRRYEAYQPTHATS